MDIIDGQLHEPGLQRYWDGTDEATQHVVLREVLHTMLAAVGVSGAVLHPLEDMSWAHGLAEREPNRFAVVPMVAVPPAGIGRLDCIDPSAPNLEECLEEVSGRPGVMAVRLLPLEGGDAAFERGGPYDVVLSYCTTRGLPVMSPFAGGPELIKAVARRFTDVTLVLDQMALNAVPGSDDDPWERLPAILDLAQYPNVSLKLTGLPSLSRAEYPYDDIRPYVSRIIETYGPERCMWASDITFYQGQVGWGNRFPPLVGPYPGKHTYAQSLAFLHDASWLNRDEKEALLGGTARRLLRWPARD